MQVFLTEEHSPDPERENLPVPTSKKMQIILEVMEELKGDGNSLTKVDLYEESMREGTRIREVFPERYYDVDECAYRYRLNYCQRIIQYITIGHVEGTKDETRIYFPIMMAPKQPAQYTDLRMVKQDIDMKIYAIQELRSRMMSALEVYNKNAKFLEVDDFREAALAIEQALEKSKVTIETMKLSKARKVAVAV